MKGLMLSQREEARLVVLNKVLERELSVREASEVLGVSERHGWRLLAAYRRKGAGALAHGNRGRPPGHTVLPDLKAKVRELVRGRYSGFNHCHLTELLEEREGIRLSRSSVWRIVVSMGMKSPRHRRPPKHRSRRERYPQQGMLLQIDGSHHDWLEGRGPELSLVGAIDDATGEVPHALFRLEEDTQGYFRLLEHIVATHGVPLAIYRDRHSIFETPPGHHLHTIELTAGQRANREAVGHLPGQTGIRTQIGRSTGHGPGQPGSGRLLATL
jgi:transposase